MTKQEAIKAIKNNKPTSGYTILCEALDMAIEALEKQIPKKVEIPAWDTARCPTCGTELSEHMGDGYYKHPKFLKVCPNVECCQKLDWGD